ncbi:MAG TPA: hypothetical protein VG941_00335 [Candidatus Paceibacterota bacterium]|nr:hypothetical protein [Candidatus Paceibacterota bacterium]
MYDKQDVIFIHALQPAPGFDDPFGFERRSVLDEQFLTLIHELIHAWHARVAEYFSNPYKRNEDEYQIDVHAARILREEKEFINQVILELSVSPNCSIIYEVTEGNPFWLYHKKLTEPL